VSEVGNTSAVTASPASVAGPRIAPDPERLPEPERLDSVVWRVAAIAAGAFEPFYARIFVADRAGLVANEITLPFRKLPGSREFILDVQTRTQPGDVIAIAAPFQKWDEGYRYLYMRSLYPLSGRIVLPLIDEHDHQRGDNLMRANVVAAYRCEPSLPGFGVVWRGREGVVLRRMP